MRICPICGTEFGPNEMGGLCRGCGARTIGVDSPPFQPMVPIHPTIMVKCGCCGVLNPKGAMKCSSCGLPLKDGKEEGV